MNERDTLVFEDTLTDAIEDKINSVFKKDNARELLYQLALMQRISDMISEREIYLDPLKKKYVNCIEKDDTFNTAVVNQLWQNIVASKLNDCVSAMDDIDTIFAFIEDAVHEVIKEKFGEESITLTDFFKVLSDALNETIKPCPKLRYDTDTVSLKEFSQKWYQFLADVWAGKTHYGTHEVIVVPTERLVDFLSSKAFYEDDPSEVPNEWLKHIHFGADDESIIRQDVKNWVDEDRDEAIEGIAAPLESSWVKFANTDVLVIEN